MVLLLLLFTVTARRHLDHYDKLGSRSRNFASSLTSRPRRGGRRVELLSFPFARSRARFLFVRNPTLSIDAAEPGPGPPCTGTSESPLSSLRAIISPSPSYHTSRFQFHHFFSPQPLPAFSQGDALTLTASSNTDRSAALPRASTATGTGRRRRPDQRVPRMAPVAYPAESAAKRRFWRNNAGCWVPAT